MDLIKLAKDTLTNVKLEQLSEDEWKLDFLYINKEDRPIPVVGGKRDAPFYVVTYGIPVSNYPHSPDDVDLVECGASQSFEAAVLLAISALIELAYDAASEARAEHEWAASGEALYLSLLEKE